MSGALVIGGGLAGSAAALVLAEAGVPVRRLAAGPGATALTGGSIDVAAASPGVPHLPWRDPRSGEALPSRARLRILLSGASRHPYTTTFGAAGGEALAAAFERATERLAGWLRAEGIDLHGSLDRNLLLPSAQGTLRISDLALTGVASSDLGGCRKVTIVDVPGVEGWDARGCARTLASEIAALGLGPLPVEVVRARDDRFASGAGSPARIAARLDGAEGEGLLKAALEGLGGADELVLLPQVLGLVRTRALLASVSQGRPVGEALSFPPFALAGYRLTRALDRACAAAGVELLRGRAGRVLAAEGRLRVEPEQPGAFEALEPEGLVLATGRFVGGGLEAGPRGVHEPLLGLPVSDPDGRRVDGIPAHRSVRKGYANPQPLYAAGVSVDGALRPQPTAPAGVWAAGEWIGGFDPARERTGLGVALLTGIAAGERAARHVLGSNDSGQAPRGPA